MYRVLTSALHPTSTSTPLSWRTYILRIYNMHINIVYGQNYSIQYFYSCCPAYHKEIHINIQIIRYLDKFSYFQPGKYCCPLASRRSSGQTGGLFTPFLRPKVWLLSCEMSWDFVSETLMVFMSVYIFYTTVVQSVRSNQVDDDYHDDNDDDTNYDDNDDFMMLVMMIIMMMTMTTWWRWKWWQFTPPIQIIRQFWSILVWMSIPNPAVTPFYCFFSQGCLKN